MCLLMDFDFKILLQTNLFTTYRFIGLNYFVLIYFTDLKSNKFHLKSNHSIKNDTKKQSTPPTLWVLDPHKDTSKKVLTYALDRAVH